MANKNTPKLDFHTASLQFYDEVIARVGIWNTRACVSSEFNTTNLLRGIRIYHEEVKETISAIAKMNRPKFVDGVADMLVTMSGLIRLNPEDYRRFPTGVPEQEVFLIPELLIKLDLECRQLLDTVGQEDEDENTTMEGLQFLSCHTANIMMLTDMNKSNNLKHNVQLVLSANDRKFLRTELEAQMEHDRFQASGVDVNIFENQGYYSIHRKSDDKIMKPYDWEEPKIVISEQRYFGFQDV